MRPVLSAEVGPDLLLIGRAGVDLYSLDLGRSIAESTKFAKYVGGTAANVAVGAARLGLKATLVTRVGDDDLGDYILSYLGKEGVDVTHISKDKKGRTGIVFAEITPGKDGRFVFYREKAADLMVGRQDVPATLIGRSRALLVTGTGLSADPSARTVYSALAMARARGVDRVLNLDWRPSLWSASKERRVSRYARAIRLSNYLIGNEGEYVAATGIDDPEGAVNRVLGMPGKTVVVTKGARGSAVYADGRRFDAPGFAVEHMIGLGGGDGFISGFMFGVLKGWELGKAAEFGNAVGAIVVTGHACSESMPTYAQVTKFLGDRQ